MGSHRPGGRSRRSLSGRIALAAVLAVLTGSVLAGVGIADEFPARLPVDPGPVAAPMAPALGPGAAVPAAEPDPVPPPATGGTAPASPDEAESEPEAEDAQDPAPPDQGAAPQAAGPAPTGPAAAPSPETFVPGTPCTASARACVDIGGRKAWLLSGGEIVRGPVPVMIGDVDHATPRGTFAVEWKAEQYTSREYLVQMPYSVFFAPGGVAFHEGNQETYSGGCVKLDNANAVAFFRYLQVGDEVQVV